MIPGPRTTQPVRRQLLPEADSLRQQLGERDAEWEEYRAADIATLKAAEAEAATLKEAIVEYLTSETAGGDPIGPQWYIDCNERTKGKHYPSKARLARAALNNK